MRSRRRSRSIPRLSPIFNPSRGGTRGQQEKQGIAAYLPIQNVGPVRTTELDDSIQQLVAQDRVTRVEGFNTMRAPSHSLAAIALPLAVFSPSEEFHLKPLTSLEERVFLEGIYNQKTEEVCRQLPQIDVTTIAMMVSVSDQGTVEQPQVLQILQLLQVGAPWLFPPPFPPFPPIDLEVAASRFPEPLQRELLSSFEDDIMIININININIIIIIIIIVVQLVTYDGSAPSIRPGPLCVSTGDAATAPGWLLHWLKGKCSASLYAQSWLQSELKWEKEAAKTAAPSPLAAVAGLVGDPTQISVLWRQFDAFPEALQLPPQEAAAQAGEMLVSEAIRASEPVLKQARVLDRVARCVIVEARGHVLWCPSEGSLAKSGDKAERPLEVEVALTKLETESLGSPEAYLSAALAREILRPERTWETPGSEISWSRLQRSSVSTPERGFLDRHLVQLLGAKRRLAALLDDWEKIDHYAILGVPRTVSDKELRNAYRNRKYEQVRCARGMTAKFAVIWGRSIAMALDALKLEHKMLLEDFLNDWLLSDPAILPGIRKNPDLLPIPPAGPDSVEMVERHYAFLCGYYGSFQGQEVLVLMAGRYALFPTSMKKKKLNVELEFEKGVTEDALAQHGKDLEDEEMENAVAEQLEAPKGRGKGKGGRGGRGKKAMEPVVEDEGGDDGEEVEPVSKGRGKGKGGKSGRGKKAVEPVVEDEGDDEKVEKEVVAKPAAKAKAKGKAKAKSAAKPGPDDEDDMPTATLKYDWAEKKIPVPEGYKGETKSFVIPPPKKCANPDAGSIQILFLD
ncbi:hypothetical protein AK812_SmicGene29300 [Symbiodinium microadriaticum]|uniref:J domain-containing protein n=1 Tax=Symbiodinium microadriaticum TaxID=2951 RepID=A0A1Q9D252_SYMMI|nr:hypothetical protein AK812_SmicGene29300 [Symbiodinium microadriaticum]